MHTSTLDKSSWEENKFIRRSH